MIEVEPEQPRESTRLTEELLTKNSPCFQRILVATDNHLGVHEKDQVRKDDSFITFREIFEHARQQKVDCVFLGGDLFDQNKPSRCVGVPVSDSLLWFQRTITMCKAV